MLYDGMHASYMVAGGGGGRRDEPHTILCTHIECAAQFTLAHAVKYVQSAHVLPHDLLCGGGSCVCGEGAGCVIVYVRLYIRTQVPVCATVWLFV